MLFFFDEMKPFIYASGEIAAFQLGGFYTDKQDRKLFQFVRVSKKGYNFINIQTGQCLLSSHMFVPKKFESRCKNGVFFFDNHYRKGAELFGHYLKPVSITELSDVVLKIQSRQKKSR